VGHRPRGQRPFGTATPTSGLKPHRFVPRLISLAPSYWLVGDVIVRLVPTMTFLGVFTNSRKPIAGLPARLTSRVAAAGAFPFPHRRRRLESDR
jgi:hypothetical protein